MTAITQLGESGMSRYAGEILPAKIDTVRDVVAEGEVGIGVGRRQREPATDQGARANLESLLVHLADVLEAVVGERSDRIDLVFHELLEQCDFEVHSMQQVAARPDLVIRGGLRVERLIESERASGNDAQLADHWRLEAPAIAAVE